MGMPALLTANATGTTAVWTPDWMQTPFSVAIAASVISTGGVAPGYNIEYTLNDLDAQGIGTSPANAVWFVANSAIATTVAVSIALTSPVRGLRINLVTATATTFIQANFIQATFGR
jgi:hypothetical protein